MNGWYGWYVKRDDYDDYNIYGVFTRENDARACVTALNAAEKNEAYSYYEVEIDPDVATLVATVRGGLWT